MMYPNYYEIRRLFWFQWEDTEELIKQGLTIVV